MTGTANSYPPIEDYAVIGNGKSAALVSRTGSIDWLCLPNFSGPSVFAAILDRSRGGCFSITPADPHVRIQRRYLGDSAVLETLFVTASGKARLVDCMPMHADRLDRLEPQAELLRSIECLSGRVDLAVRYRPRPDYARKTAPITKHGALGWSCSDGGHWYHLHASFELDAAEAPGEIDAAVALTSGEKHYCSLSYEQNEVGTIAPPGAEAERRLQRTLDWWSQWADACCYDGPYRAQVVRSAITVKLLSYSLSGAIVAAPSMSLPAAIGGNQNWDYRFCWLRDAAITLRAFLDLGYRYEGEAFLAWLLHATRLTRPYLQVAYDIFGENHFSECVFDHLEGYRRTKPVRCGNVVSSQLQLDTYGSVLMAAANYVRYGGKLERDEKRLLAQLGKTICRQWRLDDHGIWELRGEPKAYTYSKFMCWLGLDCLLKMHAHGQVNIDAVRLKREREEIRAAIETRAYRADLNTYEGILGGGMTDASLLLMGVMGYRPAGDGRMQGLFNHLETTMAKGPHFYRYTMDGDDRRREEAAFGLCSFWAVEFQAMAGNVERAGRSFEQLLACANDVGLYAEQIDPDTGGLFGNFPQAFTHVGLVNAAFTLQAAAKRDRSRGSSAGLSTEV